VKYKVSKVSMPENGLMAGKEMTVSLEPTAKGMIGFDAKFTLIKDNLINVDMVPEIDPPAFEIPSLVLNESVYPINKIYATGNLSQYVTIPKEGEIFYFEIHVK